MNYENIVLICGLSVFFIAFLLELIFAFIEKERARRIVKAFPSLILFVIVCILFPDKPYIYLGTLFGFIGDFILLWQENKKIFYLGGFTFYIGHVFYLVSLLILSKIHLEWYFYLIAVVCYFVFFIVFYFISKKSYSILITLIVTMYFYLLFFMIVTSLIISIQIKEYYYLLITLGYTLFIVSDALIYKKNFKHKTKRADFYIMLTYMLAQLSIVLGFIIPLLIN